MNNSICCCLGWRSCRALPRSSTTWARWAWQCLHPRAGVCQPGPGPGLAVLQRGSNLGGAFLLRQAQRLGLDAGLGACHLAPPPQGRALPWRQFVARLDGLSLDAQQEAEVVAGVIAAFGSYQAHLRAEFA